MHWGSRREQHKSAAYQSLKHDVQKLRTMLELRENGRWRHSQQHSVGMHPRTPSTECALHRGNGQTLPSALRA